MYFWMFQAMSYSSFIFKQASVPDDSIPYVVVGQGAINVIATIIAVSRKPSSRLFQIFSARKLGF